MILGLNTGGEDFQPRTIMPRRSALKLLGGALALQTANVTMSAAEKPIWKTAVGLNGFQSGTR